MHSNIITLFKNKIKNNPDFMQKYKKILKFIYFN
jgi:hypothetical protein